MNASNQAKGVNALPFWKHKGFTRKFYVPISSLFFFLHLHPSIPPTDEIRGKNGCKKESAWRFFLVMFLGRVNQLHDLCTWYFPIRNQLCVNFKVYSSTGVETEMKKYRKISPKRSQQLNIYKDAIFTLRWCRSKMFYLNHTS